MGRLDFLVHSIAFSPKEALQGRVVDASREGFLTTLDVSCWTFIRMAHLAEPLMRKGGTLFTMTYYGSQMVVKNYNIMGVAKAALESAVRYVAAELGPKGIRVHAISPGPLATRAASGIPEFDALLNKAKAKAPARSLVSIDDVGVATAFLAHDAARLITGETLYIDGGYHIMDSSVNDDSKSLPLSASNEAFVVLAIRLVCLGLLAYWALILIRPFLTIIVWSIIIAVALYPIFEWLSAKLYGRRALAAITITLLSLLVILGPATWLGLSLAKAFRYSVCGLAKVRSQFLHPLKRSKLGR